VQWEGKPLRGEFPATRADDEYTVALLNAAPALITEIRRLRAIEAAAKIWMEWGGHCPTCLFTRLIQSDPFMRIDPVDYCDCGWSAAYTALAEKEQP
jgi:hypothetical protein